MSTSRVGKRPAGGKASRRQRQPQNPRKASGSSTVRRKRRVIEQPIHMNSVQWYQATYAHILAFHVPNGEKRDRKTADKLQRMGVLPGVADWLIFPMDGRRIAIEFKHDGDDSEQNVDQKRFQKAWCRTGGLYFIARSVDEFKTLCVELLGPSFASFVLR